MEHPDSTPTRTALLAGATGLVGRALLTRMVDESIYLRVMVLGRRPPEIDAAAIEYVPTDFGDLDRLGERLAADDAFCCLGTTIRRAGSRAAFERVDLDYVVAFARAARAAGARQFLVVSAVGASPRATSFYSRVKGRMERAVSELGFATVHILRPSLLLGERAESRPAERLGQLAAPLLSPLLHGSLRRYRPVHADDVAAAMAALATRKSGGVRVHHLPIAES